MTAGPALSQQTFASIRELIFNLAGITLTEDKDELIKARLGSRLRVLGIADYTHYLDRVRRDPGEFSNMVDLLTTNKTSFFREQHHYDFILRNVLPRWREERRPRQIWSAGCSSGEEPYSIAMLLREHLPAADVRILATDLSRRVLTQAKEGVYPEETVSTIPAEYRGKYLRARGPGMPRSYQVLPTVSSMVSFARLNLMAEWPMRGPFDLILCRNVMIYFDDTIRTQLARRFAEKLAPEACLFIGHAESLFSLSQPLRMIEPAIYVR